MSISLIDIVGPKGMVFIEHMRRYRPESTAARLADALEMAEDDLYDEKQKSADLRRKLERTEETLTEILSNSEIK